ncbi:UDP-glucose--hexose-1-phosphate uridylyltransferase [Thalassobacillus devorans]|uniref:UDP-glucose--hexose-1-phosphate uridylyltransferase n=1 Tax=Thalassobacillus devorans TaxID=279813 RepID=UPI00048F2462|nr:UDP-glucose--hexose-1-phosphate uridylyltransferase [Thalassobacillus devorans]
MIYQHIEGLIKKALSMELIKASDVNYVRNQLMGLLSLKSFPEKIDNPSTGSIPHILENIIADAIEIGLIENIFDEKEILSANIMNCFIARPSVINEEFYDRYTQSPRLATNYFYNLSKNSNYIHINRISKNISYKTETQYGEMDITINLSKPEKDPVQIKREREVKQKLSYPKCVLCKENEGYLGRTGYPARANHRIIKVPILGENWYLQYSPYVYYNEHSILFFEEHRNMKIDKTTFERLLVFTDKFPHYFIGSNADLPIVGGSILNHDHYQSGKFEFAITKAKTDFYFKLRAFPKIDCSVLEWPMSVLRLKGTKLSDLVNAANHVLNTWKNYSDPLSDISAFTDNVPHNTITPIARQKNGEYELDLVLRNNRTSEEHPSGIFHPHADVHHIKKENIGLIEVMGLAILPPRLKTELLEVKKYLQGKGNNIPDYHQKWAEQLKDKYNTIHSEEEAKNIIQKELGNKFIKALEDAGVLKNRAAFNRFINKLNE